MSKTYGFALFGGGSIGRIRLETLARCCRARLLWMVEAQDQLQATKELVQGYGLDSVQFASSDQENLPLNDPEVDAVIISTPTRTHERLVHKALDAGKAVMCEKPVTLDPQTTAACYDKAEAKGLPLLCCFHRRHDPAFSEFQRAVRDETYGALRLLKISSHDMGPPNLTGIQNSGGIWFDSTIHDLDVALWVCGGRPRALYAQGQAWSPGVGACGDVDLLTVSVTMDTGVQVLCDNGRQAAFGYSQRTEALCERGTVEVTDPPQSSLVRRTAASTSLAPTFGGFGTRYAQAYRQELLHFLDVLQGLSRPTVGREDVLGAMQLAQATALSLSTGLPVRIPEPVSAPGQPLDCVQASPTPREAKTCTCREGRHAGFRASR